MAHRTARLNLFGRRLLVTRIAIDGWPIAVSVFSWYPKWAERFIKTLLAEWAYGRLYRTYQERLDALPGWATYYNAERTHTALGGITPMEALINNLHGNHT